MKDSSVYFRLNPIVDNILYRVENHEYQISIYQDIIDWNEEDEAKWELSEDETELNQNVVGKRERMGKDFIEHAWAELEYHKREFEEARVLMRIYMDAFNGGWIF